MKKANGTRIASIVLVVMSLFIAQTAWTEGFTAAQNWPIQLGTSGGNAYDSSKLYCCSGTLGALVQDASGTQYVLSNNHVLARTNLGKGNDPIIQPGLIDQSPVCAVALGDTVANLSKWVPIAFSKSGKNTVDAAIAQVFGDRVDGFGSILGIGQVSSETVAPSIGMPVQKSGRTTGHTTGTIAAINATLSVKYSKTCGVGSQTARFINQFRIDSNTFSAGGDSGSLIVEGCSPYPRAVGLLFAGGSTTTFANPINNVLSSFNVSIVGTPGFCSASSSTAGSNIMTAQSPLPQQANQKAIEAVTKVKERHEEALFRLDGVVGVGVGLSGAATEEVVIEVYTKRPVHEMKHSVPKAIENVPVRIVETGEIIAF